MAGVRRNAATAFEELAGWRRVKARRMMATIHRRRGRGALRLRRWSSVANSQAASKLTIATSMYVVVTIERRAGMSSQ